MKKWPPIAFSGPGDTHVNANMSLGQRGSWPDGAGYQQIIDEMCAVIVKSGITLDGDVSTQLAQAVRSQSLNYRAAGGTANALTVALDPAPDSYAALRSLYIVPQADNAAGAGTLRVGSLSPLPLRYRGSDSLPASVLQTNIPVLVICDGASMHVVGPTPSQAPKGYAVFASGVTPWTVPAGVSAIRARIWAGGGGGGGAATGAAGNPCAGAGGGSGEYREGVFAVTPGQVISMTVGTGGNGGAAGGGNGGNGGISSVGALMSAGAGSFGLGSTVGLSSGIGLPSTGAGGQFYLSGNAGGFGTRYSSDYAAGGVGGAAPLSGYSGVSSGSNVNPGNGYAGLTPGGGGGGGVGGGGGGLGANGLIVIEYWG